MDQLVESEPIKVRGFFRVALENPDGSIQGDSGFQQNQITNEGFRNFMARLLGGIAGSSQITHVNVGTGGAPAASDTSLAGEVVGTGGVVVRTAISAATSSSSKAVTFTATLSSANSFITASSNISNVGLWGASTGGTLFAGNTFSSSSCGTNQNVNVTYTISFS